MTSTDTTSRHTFPHSIITAVATTMKWHDLFPGESVAAEMTNGANGEVHFGLTGRIAALDLDTRDAEFAAATERALSNVPSQLRDDRISPAQLAVFTIGHGAWLTGKATAARAMDDADAALRGAMTAVVRGVVGDMWERVHGQWQRHADTEQELAAAEEAMEVMADHGIHAAREAYARVIDQQEP